MARHRRHGLSHLGVQGGTPWILTGFRVWGLVFRIWGLGFRVWGLGFRVSCLGFRVQGFGFWV